MTNSLQIKTSSDSELNVMTKSEPLVCRPACPVCGGTLIEIRHKLQCTQCHTICETCCEGGRG